MNASRSSVWGEWPLASKIASSECGISLWISSAWSTGQIQSWRPTMTSVGQAIRGSSGRQSYVGYSCSMTNFRTASLYRVSARAALAASASALSWK